MSEADVIYFAEGDIVITNLWAMFGERKYAISAIKSAWLEEAYGSLIEGGLIAFAGLMMMLALPGFTKIAGFAAFAYGATLLTKRIYIVKLTISLETDPAARYSENGHETDAAAYSSNDREFTRNIVDAIIVAKMKRATEK